MSFKLLFNSDRYDSKRSLVRNRQKTRTLFSSFFSIILDKLTNFWNINNIILFLSIILILYRVKIIYYRSKVKKTKRKGSIMTRKKFSMSSTYFDEIYFRPDTQVKRYVCCLIVITLRTAAATDRLSSLTTKISNSKPVAIRQLMSSVWLTKHLTSVVQTQIVRIFRAENISNTTDVRSEEWSHCEENYKPRDEVCKSVLFFRIIL